MLENISGHCAQGVSLANITGAKLRNIQVADYTGALLTLTNVQGTGLEMHW